MPSICQNPPSILPITKINQIQPIDHPHGLDQIPLEVQMHPIVFTRLDAHVPCPEGVDTSFRRFNADAFFKDHQRLVALANKPLVRFPDAC